YCGNTPWRFHEFQRFTINETNVSVLQEAMISFFSALEIRNKRTWLHVWYCAYKSATQSSRQESRKSRSLFLNARTIFLFIPLPKSRRWPVYPRQRRLVSFSILVMPISM